MRKRSDFVGLQLTPKILSVLQEVNDYGFRTISELRQGVLKSEGREWAWRIMKRLVTANLVRVVHDSTGAHLGWSPHTRTKSILLQHGLSSIVEDAKPPKYSTSFQHDMEVRWILDHFKKFSTVKKIVPESKLKRDAFIGIRGQRRREINRILSLIPDARITIQSDGHTYEVALEVELTQKTHERIQTKLEHYIAKSGYDFVIYVCADERIYSLIRRNYDWVFENSPTVKFADQKTEIYLCLHQQLKSNFLKTKLRSRSDEFIVCELAS